MAMSKMAKQAKNVLPAHLMDWDNINAYGNQPISFTFGNWHIYRETSKNNTHVVKFNRMGKNIYTVPCNANNEKFYQRCMAKFFLSL